MLSLMSGMRNCSRWHWKNTTKLQKPSAFWREMRNFRSSFGLATDVCFWQTLLLLKILAMSHEHIGDSQSPSRNVSRCSLQTSYDQQNLLLLRPTFFWNWLLFGHVLQDWKHLIWNWMLIYMALIDLVHSRGTSLLGNGACLVWEGTWFPYTVSWWQQCPMSKWHLWSYWQTSCVVEVYSDVLSNSVGQV